MVGDLLPIGETSPLIGRANKRIYLIEEVEIIPLHYLKAADNKEIANHVKEIKKYLTSGFYFSIGYDLTISRERKRRVEQSKMTSDQFNSNGMNLFKRIRQSLKNRKGPKLSVMANSTKRESAAAGQDIEPVDTKQFDESEQSITELDEEEMKEEGEEDDEEIDDTAVEVGD